MSDLITLVKTYRLTRGLAERLDLTERIVPLVQQDLRNFVFSFRLPDPQDVLQEVLKAVFVNLGKFKGDTLGQFWGWCYTITRNEIADAHNQQNRDPLQFMPEEELWQVMESSVASSGMSAADRMDLAHILKLLAQFKPECEEYLWLHYIFGLKYAEIAAQKQVSYDSVRMKIGRCLDEAQTLVA